MNIPKFDGSKFFCQGEYKVSTFDEWNQPKTEVVIDFTTSWNYKRYLNIKYIIDLYNEFRNAYQRYTNDNEMIDKINAIRLKNEILQRLVNLKISKNNENYSKMGEIFTRIMKANI